MKNRFFNIYLATFAAICTLLCASFYLLLSYFIETQRYTALFISAILYGIGQFSAGFLCGRKDPYSGYIGFNYHLCTFIICVSAAWIFYFLRGVPGALSITIFWLPGVLIHFYVFLRQRRNHIRGYSKSDIFE